MEDHLRNKYRLDQEWQALSSYEAEPSTSVLIASKVRISSIFIYTSNISDNIILGLILLTNFFLVGEQFEKSV